MLFSCERCFQDCALFRIYIENVDCYKCCSCCSSIYIFLCLIFSKYKTFLYDDKIPAFELDCLIKLVEALDLMLNTSPDDVSVCLSKPISVHKAATFIIAKKSVGNLDDIKADDLSVWIHKGKPIRKYRVHRLDSGEVYAVEPTSDVGENVYKLTRVYHHHKHTPTYRRTFFHAKGKSVCVCVF